MEGLPDLNISVWREELVSKEGHSMVNTELQTMEQNACLES